MRPATSTALETVRRPGFRPALRPDVKFSRTSSATIVVVTIGETGRMHQLYDFECLLAKEMDGTRDLDELARRARRIVPGSSRPQMEKFVVQCAALGLLQNLSVDASMPGQVTPLVGTGVTFDQFQAQLQDEIETKKSPKAKPEELYPPNFDEVVTVINDSIPDDYPLKTEPDVGEVARRVTGRNGADALPTQPSLPPQVMDEVKQAIAAANATPAAQRKRVHTPPVIVAPEAAVPEAAPPDPPPEPTASAPEPEAEAPAPEPAAEEAPPAAEEAPWVPDKKPWYAMRWFRWLRVWGTFALLVGGLQLIPWPRYVTEECLILPVGRVEVRAEIDGILTQIAVDEGAAVKKGDLLARLDDRDLQAQLRQAKAQIDSLTANLDKMKRGSRKEEIARAKATLASRQHDLKFAKLELDRREQLLASGVGSAEQRDQSARDVELKRNSVVEAEADVRLLKAGYRPEEVAVAEADLRKAQADQQYLEKKLSLLTITSPIDGVVMTPKFRERLHDKIAAGAAVCEVADTSKVRVEIFVPERQLDVVQIGQPTVVKVQSYPLHPFHGTLKFIGSAIEERNGERVLRATTEVDNHEGLLREQMSGYGEINTGKSTVLKLLFRRVVRWVRVRFLI